MHTQLWYTFSTFTPILKSVGFFSPFCLSPPQLIHVFLHIGVPPWAVFTSRPTLVFHCHICVLPVILFENIQCSSNIFMLFHILSFLWWYLGCHQLFYIFIHQNLSPHPSKLSFPCTLCLFLEISHYFPRQKSIPSRFWLLVLFQHFSVLNLLLTNQYYLFEHLSLPLMTHTSERILHLYA